jgi:hypothetical protein
VKYQRNADGSGSLIVPSCTKTLAEWNENPVGPPPVLGPGDITTTSLWGYYVHSALTADIAEAKEREDSKHTPPKPQPPDIEMSTAKNVRKAAQTKKQPAAKRKAKPDPELEAALKAAQPPLNVGTAGFASPAEFGIRPTSPSRGR